MRPMSHQLQGHRLPGAISGRESQPDIYKEARAEERHKRIRARINRQQGRPLVALQSESASSDRHIPRRLKTALCLWPGWSRHVCRRWAPGLRRWVINLSGSRATPRMVTTVARARTRR